MACARLRIPSRLRMLFLHEMEASIKEANLGREDAVIAKLYLIDQIPQIDIAVECGYDRSTISKRLKSITRRVERTAEKLGYL